MYLYLYCSFASIIIIIIIIIIRFKYFDILSFKLSVGFDSARV